MRKLMVPVILLASLIYGTGISAADKPNVAVLDFSGKNVSADDVAVITDFFRSDLTKTGKFTVLDRRNISKVLEEQAMQRTGVTDVDSAVQIGKLLNVQYIFTGSYSRLDDIYFLNVEMINIQTGKIENSGSRSARNPDAKAKLDLARFVAWGFTGFGTGYELFWDGARVGFEPEWSREQAEKNLEWNRRTHTDRKVEGYYNGKKMR